MKCVREKKWIRSCSTFTDRMKRLTIDSVAPFLNSNSVVIIVTDKQQFLSFRCSQTLRRRQTILFSSVLSLHSQYAHLSVDNKCCGCEQGFPRPPLHHHHKRIPMKPSVLLYFTYQQIYILRRVIFV